MSTAAALAVAPLLRAEEKFRLNYILSSCMYGTLPLGIILPEVRKTGAGQIDIWPRVHGNQREQLEKMGHEKFSALLQEHKVSLSCRVQLLRMGTDRPGRWLCVTGLNRAIDASTISGSAGQRVRAHVCTVVS